MILERIDKSGHVLEHYCFPGNAIQLGRGYDNDLIINDPYVDPRHARLQYDCERHCFVLTDLGSQNGARLEDNVSPPVQPGESVTLESGAVVSIGKSRYRLLRDNHPVPPALPLSSWDTAYAAFGTWRAFVVVLASMLGLQVWTVYLAQPYSTELYKEMVPLLYLVLLAFGYGLVWVLLARIQRHEGRALLHANLVLAALGLASLYLLVEPVLGFNVPWLLLGGHLATVLACIGLFFMIYISCYQSTGLSPSRRVGVALLVPGVVLLGVVVSELNRPEFQSRPNHPASVVAPFWQLRTGVGEADFIEATETLYRPATEAALTRQ